MRLSTDEINQLEGGAHVTYISERGFMEKDVASYTYKSARGYLCVQLKSGYAITSDQIKTINHKPLQADRHIIFDAGRQALGYDIPHAALPAWGYIWVDYE